MPPSSQISANTAHFWYLAAPHDDSIVIHTELATYNELVFMTGDAPTKTVLDVRVTGWSTADASENGTGTASKAVDSDVSIYFEKGNVAVYLIGTPTLKSGAGTRTNEASQCAKLFCETKAEADAVCALEPGGQFSAVIIDKAQGHCALVTDRFGTQPLYYCIDEDALRCGPDPAQLRADRGSQQSAALDTQALYHYVYFHVIPAPHSIYQGVSKLKAATVTTVDSYGATESRRHWQPQFTESSDQTLEAAHASLQKALREAVRRQIRPDASTGAFLSGGLDSSTVAGLLAEEQGQGSKAFAIGFDAEGYDEMPYARLAAKHFGLQLVERYVTPDDVVEALPLIASGFSEPFGNSSALPAYFCAKAAKEAGIDVLLAGDGGDEIFAGNDRYIQKPIFDRYAALPWALRSPIETMSPLLRTLPLGAKAASFIAQARRSLPERLQHYNFLHQFDPFTVFEQGFLDQVDASLPLHEWCEEFEAPTTGTSPLNRMLCLDWQYTLADNDLRKVSQACALGGARVSYPLLDDDLVQLSTQIPSDWKLEPGQLRAFFKQALKGWLPHETITKQKHGFGLPFGVWMREHKPLAELAYDSINDLRGKGIFQDAFLQQAIALHQGGHSAYYGELIWLLAVLGLWGNARGFEIAADMTTHGTSKQYSLAEPF